MGVSSDGVNRWFVIPVFDFLRQYIGSFGLIILILAVLVKLIIAADLQSYVLRRHRSV